MTLSNERTKSGRNLVVGIDRKHTERGKEGGSGSPLFVRHQVSHYSRERHPRYPLPKFLVPRTAQPNDPVAVSEEGLSSMIGNGAHFPSPEGDLLRKPS